MATVVNARDVILQAALPNGRVAGVTMQPNIVVDPSQVTGLGLIIAGTKTVDLETSSQVYQVATSGTATPSTITLTLNLRNIVGTPSISIISGSYTGGLPALSGGPSVYTASIAYANLTTDTITIRASVTESAITYTDDVTLIKARDGVNAVNAFLTNESHTVPSSDTGVVSSYTGAGGTFKVYQGSTDVSASATYTLQSNPNSLTTSINSTTGVFSVTGGFAGGIDVATVTYRATFGSQTFDKIFTITKSKAGVAGSAGAAGQRGSRTFYVSGITVWSDATATTTASVSGGPIVNDVVTQYGTGFSQTRFWTGSVWTVVAAVVDGSLLVSGTVGASAIAAGAIRTSHLLVTGGAGLALNSDPTCLDATAWNFSSSLGQVVTLGLSDAAAGTGALELANGAWAHSQLIPSRAGATYKLSFYAKRTGSGQAYMRLHFYNAAGALIGYQVTDFDAGGVWEGITQPTTWTFYRGYAVAPAATVQMMIELYGGYPSGPGNSRYQEVRLEEMVDSSLVVLGGLRADRINTNGLDIRDTSGNVIFSAGLLNAYLPFRLQSSSNVLIQGSSATKASGGSGWDAQVYSIESYTGGAFASAQAFTDCMFGLNTDPTANASYNTIDYALHCENTGNLWAYENGSPTSLGATWAAGDVLTVSYDGSNVRWVRNGTVLRTIAVGANLQLYFDSSILATGATMHGMRFGPYGNPSAVSPNNQITSSNVSTYIASAAIGNAQIGNYIMSSNFNGTIDGSGNITADGTTGWAISKSGYAVFSNIKVRGDVQATTVTQGAVTTNTSAGYGLTGFSLNSASATNMSHTGLSFGSFTAAGGYVFIHAGFELSADCVSTSVVRVGFTIQAKVNGTNVGLSVTTFEPVYAYTSAFGTARSCRTCAPVILNIGTRTGTTTITFDVTVTWYGTTGPIAAGGANSTSRSDVGVQGYMIETRG